MNPDEDVNKFFSSFNISSIIFLKLAIFQIRKMSIRRSVSTKTQKRQSLMNLIPNVENTNEDNREKLVDYEKQIEYTGEGTSLGN